MLHEDLTEKIIGVFYKVYNELGFGFLEKVYQNALYFELQCMGLNVIAQKPIKVYYFDKLVGEYFADIIVNDTVILELKAIDYLLEEHEYQLINYLKATNIEIGLLFNFGKTPEFSRKVFGNYRKKSV